jgi:hypothetical protein
VNAKRPCGEDDRIGEKNWFNIQKKTTTTREEVGHPSRNESHITQIYGLQRTNSAQ